MDYQLNIKENALDSLKEALIKFKEGESGNLRSFKFSIQNMAHFVELILKQYVISIDSNLIYEKCFRAVSKKSKQDSMTLHNAYESLSNEGFNFGSLISASPCPYTISVDQALLLAKEEICSTSGNPLLDKEFIDDIQWMKGLRNNIAHFQFSIESKEVRLCIGRLVRASEEFLDIFSIFNLYDEIDREEIDIFHELSDEYNQLKKEAVRDADEAEKEAYRNVRPKYYALVDWERYDCPQCDTPTMIPDPYSSSGFKCNFCGNEESSDIDIACDCCGAMSHPDDMETWNLDDGIIESRCYYCSGRYHAEKDD